MIARSVWYLIVNSILLGVTFLFSWAVDNLLLLLALLGAFTVELLYRVMRMEERQ